MKKLFILVLTLIIAFSAAFAVPVNGAYDSIADTLGLHAESYYLVNLDNNKVVFEKNANKQAALASLTKVITATVVLENCTDLSAVVTVPEYCITALSGTGSSIAGLKIGEEMSVIDLLRCLLIQSANDAAMVLADYVGGGDMDSFIEMMNALAKKHGCTNTSFVNPHGLDDAYQFSTPRDLAVLTQYALTFPVFSEIVSLSKYTVPATNMCGERNLINTNYLMNKVYKDYYCAYASGVKTGSTSKAGKCVISTAKKDGYNYLCVVMNAPLINIDDDAPLENCAFVDCKAMFEYVLNEMEYVQIADNETAAAEVPVNYASKADYVTLVPAKDEYELVPKGINANSVLIQPVEDTLPASLDAPLNKGDVICKADVLYAGESIAQIDLVASCDIKRSNVLLVIAKVKAIFTNTGMKILVILILAVFLCLLALRIKNKIKLRKKHGLHVVTYNDFRK